MIGIRRYQLIGKAEVPAQLNAPGQRCDEIVGASLDLKSLFANCAQDTADFRARFKNGEFRIGPQLANLPRRREAADTRPHNGHTQRTGRMIGCAVLISHMELSFQPEDLDGQY